MERMKHDILLLGDKYKRLEGRFKVRVDLTELSLTELEYLRAGIDSTILYRGSDESPVAKCWHVPAQAVEVFIER